MARKKRRFQQLEASAATPKEKKTYVDPIQQKVVPHVEEFGKKLEGKSRTILYAVAAILVLAIVIGVVVRFNNRSSNEAQTALGKAIRTSQARISETGASDVSTEKTYRSEKERAEAAILEFQSVVDNFGGQVGEKAKYFIAVNRLAVDRPLAIGELEELAKLSSETGKLAKFALAQTREGDNRLDEALALYQELASMDDPIVAKETINFEIARIYEKQGKRQEAIDTYFNIAKTASEAKDPDGKAIPMSDTATKAKSKVKELDPEKAKEIPETSSSPFGS